MLSRPAVSYAYIGDIADTVRRAIAKLFVPLLLLVAFEYGILWFTGHPGTNCFALTAFGSFLVLKVWQHSGIGLPIVPLLAAQNLIAYGLPVVVSNESIMDYPAEQMTSAGIEILVFSLAMIGVWKFGMSMFNTGSPLCYALQGFDETKRGHLTRLGFTLITCSTVYQLLQSLAWLDFLFEILPTGSYSIINTVFSGTSACGFFLVSMLVGKRMLGPAAGTVFWTMLAVNCYVAAAGFLLSSTVTTVFSTVIGLFWGAGRVPWRFVVIMTAILSFLNLGKFEMRERYWRLGDAEYGPMLEGSSSTDHYTEWISASFAALTGASNTDVRYARSPRHARETRASGQSMLDRVNNLQNLLFVIDAEDRRNIPPLGGATYALIPPLLMPRLFWPDKPRAHEGQVLLNVHFGRQDITSTFQTYVAWGLQAEAYGNFGPVVGTAIIGAMVGFVFAWVERFVARKLLLSLEGFLSFTLFLAMANSYEMVSSVLVTSTFQAFVPVVLASLPFVERLIPHAAPER